VGGGEHIGRVCLHYAAEFEHLRVRGVVLRLDDPRAGAGGVGGGAEQVRCDLREHKVKSNCKAMRMRGRLPVGGRWRKSR
jgi:hypothetical protein